MMCKNFPLCGGCQLQNLSEGEERRLKQENFLATLRGAGVEAEIASFSASPLYSRRRCTLSAKRTKKSAIVGFTEAGTHHIVDMDMCLILHPEILALKPTLIDMTLRLASRTGLVKFHITKLAHGFDVEIENAKPLEAEVLQALARIAAAAHVHRLIINGELVFQDAPCQVEIGGLLITIPPRPFLQATTHAENVLRELAHRAVRDARHVADLFSGIGTFSYGLAMEVDAFEGDAVMATVMQQNLNHYKIHNIKSHRRDLFRDPLLPQDLARFDAVMIDPPRAGAKAQCTELAQSDLPVIAYTSCDTESFARDARILIQGGYHMNSVNLIDQFRFSNHIESYATFTR